MEIKEKNYVNQLADYIKKNLAKGYTLDSLKYSLLSQGYSRISVDNAIELVNQQLAKSAPKMREKPQITYKVITDNETYVYEKKHGFFEKLFNFFKGN
ncbi:hypothetical protein GOV12_03680 [Candidatus Pacearchaeota archaeon]|nr:hypothetical protein [Candidatus Pacearchaeota archaeon]